MISTYTSYRSTIDNMKQTFDRLFQKPQVKCETDYYVKHIIGVKSVDDFLANDKIYNYAMKAYGLEDMIFAKGMIRKVLSDPEYASQLVDKRYQQFAEAFNFSKYGEKATQRESAKTVTVNKYMQQTLEVEVGEVNEGTRLALYFTRTIGGMVQNNVLTEKNWAYQILSDKALSAVIFKAFNISENVLTSPIEVQKSLLESRMSLKDLQDPKKLEHLIAKFSAMYDVQNQTVVNPALMILQGSNVGRGLAFSNETIMALQSFKQGGL
ncbi:Protein of unknown function (DUF1217) [Bartonella sp. CDC_skunk]|uniref:DUF1217 domain-containing protein n=1 Tax=unclassified Bartonella TaxID=2645622 RepID=UPI0009995FB0|nr:MULTISPECIES: DUF1217 domain-containing protein [unclassified Bartonella]AQX21626.1 Protein of unknown function (DUF1217) [Bartonella sp. CDC_skunk]AQX26890.1 Protein of unknown function (DUF1217) [Bartonella sp. Raccoon60]